MKRFFLFAVAFAMTVCMLASCATVNKVQLGVIDGQGQNVQATLGTVMPENQPNDEGGNLEDDPNTLPEDDGDNTGDVGDTTPGGDDANTPEDTTPGGDDANTPEDTNPGADDEGADEGEGEDEPAEVDPDDENSGYYKILSYNLKAMYYDYKTQGTVDQREGVANYIKEHSPALVGLQEIDNNNPRSFSYDQMKYLGEQTGYYYYFFSGNGATKDFYF